jgi:hypothetical protein
MAYAQSAESSRGSSAAERARVSPQLRPHHTSLISAHWFLSGTACVWYATAEQWPIEIEEGERPTSTSACGPLSRDASEELVAMVEKIRQDSTDRKVVCHGWNISFTLRSTSKQLSGRRQGDFVIVDPSDGERMYSVVLNHALVMPR